MLKPVGQIQDIMTIGEWHCIQFTLNDTIKRKLLFFIVLLDSNKVTELINNICHNSCGFGVDYTLCTTR
uniref:Uncharacterized protein n=1 Tax=Lepeophtheirus salmonis TaxID=72036 RepID=A0A0K2TUJ4_LEPSM